MKLDQKLMDEIEALCPDHEDAIVHFGCACIAASKAGHKCKMRRYLRRGMVVATLATIVITSCLDLISEAY